MSCSLKWQFTEGSFCGTWVPENPENPLARESLQTMSFYYHTEAIIIDSTHGWQMTNQIIVKKRECWDTPSEHQTSPSHSDTIYLRDPLYFLIALKAKGDSYQFVFVASRSDNYKWDWNIHLMLFAILPDLHLFCLQWCPGLIRCNIYK